MGLFKKKNTEDKVVPTKPKANRLRSERLSLCLTDGEKQLITNAANEAGISRTDLIVKAVKAQRPIVITGAANLCLELTRQGNNLNQLVRRLNSYSRVSNTEIQKTAAACREAYKELIRFINVWNMKLKQMEVSNSDSQSESCK